MNNYLEHDWQDFLHEEFDKAYFKRLMDFVKLEYEHAEVFPPAHLAYHAFNLCSLANTRVVILGQDPYHDVNQSHGLCFSVQDGVKQPPSLVNIFKELASDLGVQPPLSGNLERWARQGVLLLNATLTVRAHQAGSHQKQGWEVFTDSVIHRLSATKEHLVFMLWGAYAQKKISLIDAGKHLVLCSAHPSPLSAYRGFLGNRHFSKANEYLQAQGMQPINW